VPPPPPPMFEGGPVIIPRSIVPIEENMRVRGIKKQESCV